MMFAIARLKPLARTGKLRAAPLSRLPRSILYYIMLCYIIVYYMLHSEYDILEYSIVCYTILCYIVLTIARPFFSGSDARPREPGYSGFSLVEGLTCQHQR